MGRKAKRNYENESIEDEESTVNNNQTKNEINDKIRYMDNETEKCNEFNILFEDFTDNLAFSHLKLLGPTFLRKTIEEERRPVQLAYLFRDETCSKQEYMDDYEIIQLESMLSYFNKDLRKIWKIWKLIN